MSFIRSSKIKWPLDTAGNRGFCNSHFRVEGCKNNFREGRGERTTRRYWHRKRSDKKIIIEEGR